MLRILTVYERNAGTQDRRFRDLVPLTMAYIRWFKISEELARRGHAVDVAVTDVAREWGEGRHLREGGGLRRVLLSEVRWDDYDVVKTLFHRGFDTLEAYGGAGHPFVISKLGSVVAPEDRPGIYFYGAIRERLFATQQKVAATSHWVTLLSKPAQDLWQECFGPRDNLLLVPGGVDRDVPPPRDDPYPDDGRARVLFAGNVYTADTQAEANAVLVDKLNRLGRILSARRARLYMMGHGDVSALDREVVAYLGAVPYADSWNHFQHADVGVVVAAGSFHHNNESSKLYHYLRVGLPVVSEMGFPNDAVVSESGLGMLVPSGDMEAMADAVVAAATRDWDREAAIDYVLRNHTWERRVDTYETLLRRSFEESRALRR